jgi:hypothetical protein
MQRNLDICAKCEHHEELPETLRGMCIVPGDIRIAHIKS